MCSRLDHVTAERGKHDVHCALASVGHRAQVRLHPGKLDAAADRISDRNRGERPLELIRRDEGP